MTSLGPPRLDVAVSVRPGLTDGRAGTASTGSATGNPRNKVALAPGRSLLDWIRLGKSGIDLTGVGGQPRDVTTEELAKHCTVNDAWTALKGKVYNITAYMEYHPGGVPELMRAAGIDCTQLFDEVHRWVNYESMLSKCYVGKYIASADTPAAARRDSKNQSRQSASSQSLSSIPKFPADKSNNTKSVDVTDASRITPSVPRYDWFQNDTSITLVVYTRCERVRLHDVIVELQNQRYLKISVFVDDNTFHVSQELEQEVSVDYKVSVAPSGKVQIVFTKVDVGKKWTALGQAQNDDKAWRKTSNQSIQYWTCRVQSVDVVSHDTNLYCIQYPPGTRMFVPVGRHIFVTACVNDTDVVHSYTVVPPSLVGTHDVEDNVREGRSLCLMVKIYSDGILTPLIGRLQIDDCLQISSSYAGDFDVRRLDDVRQCIMFAAGTGFTPMAALLRHFYTEKRKSERRREIVLIFFNKTEKDILWKDQLDELTSTVDWFRVYYVLSRPSTAWSGHSGLLRKDLFEVFVPPHQSDSEPVLICSCGPTAFTQLAVKLAKELGYSDDMIHAFLG